MTVTGILAPRPGEGLQAPPPPAPPGGRTAMGTSSGQSSSSMAMTAGEAGQASPQLHSAHAFPKPRPLLASATRTPGYDVTWVRRRLCLHSLLLARQGLRMLILWTAPASLGCVVHAQFCAPNRTSRQPGWRKGAGGRRACAVQFAGWWGCFFYKGSF